MIQNWMCLINPACLNFTRHKIVSDFILDLDPAANSNAISKET